MGTFAAHTISKHHRNCTLQTIVGHEGTNRQKVSQCFQYRVGYRIGSSPCPPWPSVQRRSQSNTGSARERLPRALEIRGPATALVVGHLLLGFPPITLCKVWDRLKSYEHRSERATGLPVDHGDKFAPAAV